MLTAQQQQLQNIPDGDWPIPESVSTITLPNADAEFLESLTFCATGFELQLAPGFEQQIDAARAATLPSGRAYGQLGVRVHA